MISHDDERWYRDVAIVREVWDERGRWLATERVYRRTWQGRDRGYTWTCRETTGAFETRFEAAAWCDEAWNALHLARAQKLTADQMLLLASVRRDAQVEQVRQLLRR